MLAKALSKDNFLLASDGALADMRALPFEGGSFGGLWTMAAVVHLHPADRRIALQEFSRVLRKDGVLFLSAQNRLSLKHLQRIFQSYFCNLGYDEANNYYSYVKSLQEILDGVSLFHRLAHGYAYLDQRHWYFPTRVELGDSLVDAGFTIVRQDPLFDRRIDIMAVKR